MKNFRRIRTHLPPAIIYVCNGCGVWRSDKGQCACGRLDYEVFRSKLEATRWAQLLLLQKLKQIVELRRSVRYDLLASGQDGKPVKVATYVADFVYRRDGALVIEDVKPQKQRKDLIDPLAILKLKWMAAMGLPVTTVTPGS